MSAKDVAGIQITGGYDPGATSHGFFNSTTVITIEIELSDPYDDNGANDLTNTDIVLKMGTSSDDSQLPYHEYNVKSDIVSILNSDGGVLTGNTDPFGADPDNNPNYFSILSSISLFLLSKSFLY